MLIVVKSVAQHSSNAFKTILKVQEKHIITTRSSKKAELLCQYTCEVIDFFIIKYNCSECWNM